MYNDFKDKQNGQTTLWIGDISPEITEKDVGQWFNNMVMVSVKLIKDKVTNKNKGYGFIEFNDHETAKLSLTNLNG